MGLKKKKKTRNGSRLGLGFIKKTQDPARLKTWYPKLQNYPIYIYIYTYNLTLSSIWIPHFSSLPPSVRYSLSLSSVRHSLIPPHSDTPSPSAQSLISTVVSVPHFNYRLSPSFQLSSSIEVLENKTEGTVFLSHISTVISDWSSGKQNQRYHFSVSIFLYPKFGSFYYVIWWDVWKFGWLRMGYDALFFVCVLSVFVDIYVWIG